jgi:hypothetical protein
VARVERPPGPGGRRHVVLVDGEPAAYLERGGRTLLTFPAAADGAWVDGLVSLVKERRLPRLVVQKVDGEPAATSPTPTPCEPPASPTATAVSPSSPDRARTSCRWLVAPCDT